jgi:hypothetical protein
MRTSNYFERSGRTIKQDMLRWIQENFRARISEDWDLTGENYDPLVNMIIGACAVEMQNIYDQLYSAESRLLKKLEDVLLPDASNMPLPSHTLATALPSTSEYELSPGDTFTWVNDDPGNNFPDELKFRPLLRHHLIKGEVRYLATDSLFFRRQTKGIKNWKRFQPETSRSSEDIDHSQNLYLGLLLDPSIESLENVSIYLNLNTRQPSVSAYSSLQDIFLSAVKDSNLSIQGIRLSSRSGLEVEHEDFADYASRKGKVLHKVLSRYNPNFIVITDELKINDLDNNSNDKLPSFLKKKIRENEWVIEQESFATENLALIWLHIGLPFPVSIPNPEVELECAINQFPLANLELNKKDDSDTYFNKSSLNIISLSPENPFVCINRLYEKGDDEMLYQPLEYSHFLQAGDNTYTVRESGVGRLDDYNSWNRLSYLLRLFRKELKEDILLEKMSREFSLEELHEFIRQVRPDRSGQSNDLDPVYILLNSGSLAFGGKRIVVEYYTSYAGKANDLPEGSLLGSNPQIAEGSCLLMRATKGGKEKRSRLEQISHLRASLLTRGRITTRADVVAFSKQFFEEDRLKVKVEKAVHVDPRPGFGPLRAIRVRIIPPKGFRVQKEDWEVESRILERELTERSTMFLPFLVHIGETSNG